ncbi:MAG: D-hexose-6-phosphate mutarotase [Phycisphaeraceae bacterium]
MTQTTPAQSLNEQFAIPQTVRFENTDTGLPRAVVTTGAATAVVYLLGAHVAEYQPADQQPVLFMSREAELKPGTPIRGGVPICFPWFGLNQDDPTAPMHGTARTTHWQLTDVSQPDDQRVRLTLTLRVEPFLATYHVTVGPELEMRLRTENTGPEPARFEQALHTYFAISQIRDIEITGLAGLTYLDKPRNFERITQPSEPIRFAGEVDRVYVNHPGACTLHDPGFKRDIAIEKENANSTIVWNPWNEKSLKMTDLGADEWSGFVCIESGNVADNAVRLAPGDVHEMAATLRPRPA